MTIPSPPAAPHARVVVGGSGLKRTPRLAATYADVCNTPASRAGPPHAASV